MAGVPQITVQSGAEVSTAGRQIVNPATLSYVPQLSGLVPSLNMSSPETAVTLIERSVGLMEMHSLDANPIYPDSITVQTVQTPEVTFNVTELFARISELLDKGLTQNADRITGEIRADFQSLGKRIEHIEHKLDVTISKTTQNTDHLQFMQEQLDTAQTRIDDLENRSRRDNFRIRGLPESISDVQTAVQDIIKSLIPSVPAHKLELDRAHRSLGPLRKDGSPRDIVVKPHYYSIKEEVMKRSRQQEQIQYQGSDIQIFADISPYTIQKRRSLKPLLAALTKKDIKYRWAFPFALKFTYKGKQHAFHSFPEGERLLLDLKLITHESDMETAPTQQGSAKRQSPTSPPPSRWNKAKYRKVKDNLPP